MKLHPISDHALLRYMERVQGIDVEALKDDVLKRNPSLEAAIEAGAASITIDGATFVMKNKIVTSVIEGSSQSTRSSHIQRKMDTVDRAKRKQARLLQSRD